MPNNVVKSYAEKTGKSVDHVEKWWAEAEDEAKKKFKKKSPRFWAYVNGIVKRRAGLAENLSFKDFISNLGEVELETEELTEDKKLDDTLKKKAEESGKSLSKLKQVYNKGLAAWRKSHPPGTNSSAWAMGRVNAFIKGKIDEELEVILEAKETLDEKQKELYKRWKELINMSADSLEKFKEEQTAKGKKDPKDHPGLQRKEAAKLGISSGVESANWIIKMKKTKVEDWTPQMWKWAGKQVSFVSRMLGAAGPMKDKDGNPTRKLLSLKIWGHSPK
jgi:hypothetical protein